MNTIKISYPASEKIFVLGKMYDIQVPMRRITLLDTMEADNGQRKITHNQPVVVYDTSGPYSDDAIGSTSARQRLEQSPLRLPLERPVQPFA
jgi:hypothetical protein